MIYLEWFYYPCRNVILKIYDVIEKKNICEKNLGNLEVLNLNMEYFDGKLFLLDFWSSCCNLLIYDFKGLLNVQREDASESRRSLMREIKIESNVECFFNETSFVGVNVKKRGLEFKEIDFWRTK